MLIVVFLHLNAFNLLGFHFFIRQEHVSKWNYVSLTGFPIHEWDRQRVPILEIHDFATWWCGEKRSKVFATFTVLSTQINCLWFSWICCTPANSSDISYIKTRMVPPRFDVVNACQDGLVASCPPWLIGCPHITLCFDWWILCVPSKYTCINR